MSTREILIECARDVYVEFGYAGFSMRKVATCAGLSATAIYRHFENKNELLQQVILAGFRLYGSYLVRAQRVPDPMQRLRTTARLFLDFALEHRAYFEIMFLATDGLSRGYRLPPQAPPDEIRATFVMHLDYVKACDFETDDVLGLAVRCWALAHGLVSLHLANRLGMLEQEFRPYFEATMDGHYLTLPRRAPA